jgi:L-threonylcarbamoyladenylate synthase
VTRLVLMGRKEAAFPRDVIDALRGGGLAVYPTDTLYGLGADPRSEAGLARLLSVKGRAPGKPIPLLLDGPDRAEEWAARIPRAAARLMERFWPGALTIVVPARPDVPAAVTGGKATVGLRVPDHPVPRALAGALGGAVTGTSANRGGAPGIWRDAEEIVGEFNGAVDWVLWEGPLPAEGEAEGPKPGPASTVLRVDEEEVVLLREGVVPFRAVTEFLKKG